MDIVKLREREGQGVDPGRSLKGTNDRALFAMFARSNLNFQEPGCGDTKLLGKGRGEDTCA